MTYEDRISYEEDVSVRTDFLIGFLIPPLWVRIVCHGGGGRESMTMRKPDQILPRGLCFSAS